MSSPPLIQFRKKDFNQRYKVWLEQSTFDLKASLVSKTNEFYEWSCYQSEQAVEKALKSMIIRAGYLAPRTHKLSILIGLCNNINPRFREFKFRYRDLEIFTFISRYPFLKIGENQAPHNFISSNDAENCHEQAKIILREIEELLLGDTCELYTDYEGFGSIDIDKRIENIKNILIEKMNPYKLILFGSYARGNARLSTIDLLVIADTTMEFKERIGYVREITKGSLPVVSPLVYTPDEFNVILNQEGEGFIENAINEGKVIYQK
ncbi:HEPN domain-containing protein [Candidatus Dojkabacteria bacterium]|nr:HEPN domain-containing protein [Candidatus Dojkabacteria bacterium]